MVVLMSNWNKVESLHENYIFPPDRRPGKHVHVFPMYKDMPVIDLEKAHRVNERGQLVQEIMKACADFGMFQVINHGVGTSLMEETMSLVKEFFNMPSEYKASFYSTDINKSCRIYSSTLNYENEDIHYWRDNFTHRCHPLNDYIQTWPDKPSTYRDVIGTYCVEVRKFMLRILELIGEGLGMEEGYFEEEELSKIQLMSVNHHIPCPDPSLTLGMPEHCDPNLISILHQGSVPGLQVLKDGVWLNVQPIPTAFCVISGLQLKVISNDEFSSPMHRVMTHSEQPRTTIGTFLIPSSSTDVFIKPAGNKSSQPVYRAFKYKDFFDCFTGNKCNSEIALGFFKNNKNYS